MGRTRGTRPLRLVVGLLAGLWLAACIAGPDGGTAPGPDQPRGVIEWSSGGAFRGASGNRLFADDSLVTWQSPPFGAVQESRRQLSPGSYDRALAWLLANRLRGSDIPSQRACPDYGADVVAWSGAAADQAAEGGAIRYSAACPGSKVPALQDGIRRAITGI